MAIVMLNGDLMGVEYPAQTWGELLQLLDEQCAIAGDVVTAVHVGGTELPVFRSAQALSQLLEPGAEVLVETTAPLDLIRQTLDEAEAGAQAVADEAITLGGAYRAHDLAAANRALPGFAENLGTLIVVTSTVAQAAGVDLAECGDGELSAIQLINHLVAHTDTLVASQQAGDWPRMAGVLESDIVGTVRRWPAVLQAIRQASPALTGAA